MLDTNSDEQRVYISSTPLGHSIQCIKGMIAQGRFWPEYKVYMFSAQRFIRCRISYYAHGLPIYIYISIYIYIYIYIVSISTPHILGSAPQSI